MAKKISWEYKCAICGVTFPIWWVSADEWKAGGFKKKHVCKKCFETKVPNPNYYSIDEYLNETGDTDNMIEIVQKRFPAMTPEEVHRAVQDMHIDVREELTRVWDKK
jgi:hypothetical protein